jgi:FkbH-like protein
MFESEINTATSVSDEIPAEVLLRFAESRNTVTRKTLIPWSEHCTECVWPTCYQSCDLYEARQDGRCRRFREGMVRVDHKDALNSYLLKISFKRWAKIWAPANLALHSLESADIAERRDRRIASYIQAIPLTSIRSVVTTKRYSLKKRQVVASSDYAESPNCFLIECYNPNAEPVTITFSVRREETPRQFQRLLLVRPGFNREQISINEIHQAVDLLGLFSVDLTPNEISDGLTLYFGAMDFVLDPAFQPAPAPSPDDSRTDSKTSKPCKCVVWDLDNTLWEGTLIEDGADNIRLKTGIHEILKGLDERGILISTVSKNDHDEAMGVLKRLQIDEYFLVPQISWNPKSQGLEQIAKELNIGLDSLVFIDDSRFEIEQVKSAVPDVSVLDASRYREILTLNECQVPVTEEGRKRRMLYREQSIRERARGEFGDDYFSFLRKCDLRLTLTTLDQTNLERIHELTQRTNQMNFSGNRYSRAQLREFIEDRTIDTYVIECVDRFGSYGTVGFCVVNLQDTRMIDLMFSCRVQGKRVEHAFLTHLIRRFEGEKSTFLVDYRRTKKNAGPGKVFEDLGFESKGESGGVTRLEYQSARSLPDESIVVIDDRTRDLSIRGQR